MPLLGGLLGALFSWIATLLVDILGRRLGINVLLVSAFGGIFAALMLALKTAVTALFALLPTDNMLLMGFSMAIPPAAGTCIAAYGAVWAACALYRWQLRAIDLIRS